MAKFGNKNFRNIGSAASKILQRLSFYRQTPGADFTFGGKSFDNIASSGVPVYQRLSSFVTGISSPWIKLSIGLMYLDNIFRDYGGYTARQPMQFFGVQSSSSYPIFTWGYKSGAGPVGQFARGYPEPEAIVGAGLPIGSAPQNYSETLNNGCYSNPTVTNFCMLDMFVTDSLTETGSLRPDTYLGSAYGGMGTWGTYDLVEGWVANYNSSREVYVRLALGYPKSEAPY